MPDGAIFYECFALIIIVIGLASLIIPVLAVMSLLERRRANRNSN